ncbi:MAG: YdcH family protein [Hyphomicrobiales bacterium]
MTATPHLDRIERKYQSLKDRISQARQHPSIDDLELAELKRRKLQLKDELERLRHSEPQGPS